MEITLWQFSVAFFVALLAFVLGGLIIVEAIVRWNERRRLMKRLQRVIFNERRRI